MTPQEIEALQHALYDEDTGEYLAHIPEEASMPVQLSLFRDGYWYVFKLDSKHPASEENKE